MRKFLVSLSALTLLTALAACGGEDPAARAPILPTGAGEEQAVGAFPEPVAIYIEGVNTPTPAPAGFLFNQPAIGSGVIALLPPSGTYSGVPVTRADFGELWPFTVESGIAECEHRNRMPALMVGDKRYPLTGRMVFGWADPAEIRRDDPNNPGEKISLQPVVLVSIGECDPAGLKAGWN